jgi:hypothetical protein
MLCMYNTSLHTFPFVTQWDERIGAVILFLKVCIIIENNTINKEKKNKNMGRVTERALLKIYKYKVYVVKKKYKVYFFILLFTWSTFSLQLLIFPHCLSISISVSASSNYYQTNRRQKLQSAFRKKRNFNLGSFGITMMTYKFYIIFLHFLEEISFFLKFGSTTPTCG